MHKTQVHKHCLYRRSHEVTFKIIAIKSGRDIGQIMGDLLYPRKFGLYLVGNGRILGLDKYMP